MKQYILRKCGRHGMTEHALRSDGHAAYRCLKCRSGAVTRYRRKTKRRLVVTFGGKCTLCGYNKYVGSLDFHHIDPNTKKYGLSRGFSLSYEKLLEEAKKCILLCKNCHQEVTDKKIDISDFVVRASTQGERTRLLTEMKAGSIPAPAARGPEYGF